MLRASALLLATIRPTAVCFINQLLERLRDREHLIRPDTRAGKRRHAADRGDALGLSLEHHQVERLLAMAARAANHKKRRSDAVEFSRRDIGARMGLHALNSALDVRRLHRHSHPKTPGAMTLNAILREDLTNPQRPEHGDVALARQIRRQTRDPLLKLAHLLDNSHGE